MALTPDQELARLRRLLSRRENQPGYETNVAEIRERIAEIEGERPAPEEEAPE